MMSKEKISQGNLDNAMEGTSGNRVFCSMAKIIALPNYENIRVEYGQSMVVPDGISFVSMREKVKEEVMNELTIMVETFTGALKE